MPIKKTTPKAATTKKDALKKLTVPALRAKAKRAGIKLSKSDGSQKTKAQLVLALDKVPAPKKKVARKSASTTQYGTSNKRRDEKRQALPPGKRQSASGRVYYERRANRSDAGQLLGIDGEQEKFMFTVGIAYGKFLNELKKYKEETSRDITEKLLDIPEMFRTAEGLRADIAAAIRVLGRYDEGLDTENFDPYDND